MLVLWRTAEGNIAKLRDWISSQRLTASEHKTLEYHLSQLERFANEVYDLIPEAQRDKWNLAEQAKAESIRAFR